MILKEFKTGGKTVNCVMLYSGSGKITERNLKSEAASFRESVFLLQNKVAAQSAMSAKLFLANGGVFIRQLLYAPGLPAAE